MPPSSPPTSPSSFHSGPSRRNFLLGTAAATVAAGGAGGAGAAGGVVTGFPAILRAQDKAGTRPVILGTGEHTYQWIDNWARLPAGKRFGNTHAVVETADRRILVHSTSPTGDSVCAFDPDGNFISSWGERFAQHAHGMDLRTENGTEFLYLAPTGLHKLYKTTLTGEVVLELDYPRLARTVRDGKVVPDYAGPEKYVPTFTALAPAADGAVGDFYVADGYGSHYVHRYNHRGEYLQSWGGKGNAPGQFNCPHGIWCDTRGPEPMIVVADRGNVRLQWFTLDGQFIKLVADELRHPCHFDQRGTDLLIPDLKGRVTLFNRDNQLITHLGDNPDPAQRGNNGVKPADTRPGAFCTPHSARFDADGNIYVVEWLPYGRVTKLKKVSA